MWISEVVSYGTERTSKQNYALSPLQDGLKSWLMRVGFNALVTLTFKPPKGVGFRSAENTFAKFSAALRNELAKLHPGERPIFAPIVENSFDQLREFGLSAIGREGTHLHVLMKLPGSPEDHKELISRLWKATAKRICGDPKKYSKGKDRNGWFIELDTTELRDIYIGYVLKYMKHDCRGLLINSFNLMPPRVMHNSVHIN